MNKDTLEHARHTLAHVMAYCIQKTYKHAQLTIGPAIDNGFYYDMDFGTGEKPSTDADLKSLTKEMKRICRHGGYFTHQEVSKQEAMEIFRDNKYKQELIEGIVERGETITLYTIHFKKGDGTENGEVFTDLCRGGHCERLEDIEEDSFRVEKIAGAYWRGDESREQLTRIYGLAFATAEELRVYDEKIEEAKKRDHRVLGRELGLFIFSPLVGPGLPLWTPRGTFIRNKVNDYVQELRSHYGYGQVTIPHVTKNDLYKKSGHWEKYAEDLFKIETRDGHTLCMKPMNCPHHTQIYASELRSYKELPVRYSETTMVYRDEQSGELNGLSRVISITQDDAHIFCRESQLEEEMNGVWNLIETLYTTFGFTSLTPRFSRRNDDPKFKGNKELWVKAETAIHDLLEKRAPGKWIDGEGEAAFYGPKVDFMAQDAIGREHQVGTIQVDFVQPTNFELEYVNEQGEREMPVMIHCAVTGSLERFMSVYIEHTAGNFPLWISPTQVSVIPVRETHSDHAKTIAASLAAAGIRAELCEEKHGLGKNVRAAKQMKYPYWIVVGDAEMAENTVTLESRSGEKVTLPLAHVIERFKKEVEEKK